MPRRPGSRNIVQSGNLLGTMIFCTNMLGIAREVPFVESNELGEVCAESPFANFSSSEIGDGCHDDPRGVLLAADLFHRAPINTSKLHRWVSTAARELNIEGTSESRVEGLTVLIPAGIRALVSAMEPLMADESPEPPSAR